jgi:signal peptidase
LSWFFAPYWNRFLPFGLADFSQLILLSAYLLLLFAIARKDFLKIRVDRHVLESLLLGLVFVAVLLEPLTVSRFSYQLFPGWFGLYSVAYAFVYSIFIQSFFLNYNSRRNILRGDGSAINVPFLLFLVMLFQADTLLALPSESPASVLSFTIYILSNIVLFYFLYVLYIKSGMNNVPGILFFFIIGIPSIFRISYHTSLILSTVWVFVDYGIAFLVLEMLTKENRYSRRLFRYNRISSRRSIREAAAFIIFVGVVLSFVFVISPYVYETPHPFLADPTGSMYPVIKPGSMLIVKGENPAGIHVGQILVFRAPWDPNLTVAHEVIRVFYQNNQLYFQTKGIANSVQDPLPVPAADVKGIVVASIPYLGYAFIYSYAIISAALLITVVYFTVRFR